MLPFNKTLAEVLLDRTGDIVETASLMCNNPEDSNQVGYWVKEITKLVESGELKL